MPLFKPYNHPDTEIELEDASLLVTRPEQHQGLRSILADNRRRSQSSDGNGSRKSSRASNDEASTSETSGGKMAEASSTQLHPAARKTRALTRHFRSGTTFCIGIVCLVLIINVTGLIASVAKFEARSGTGTLYRGSCDTVSTMSTAIHILINILSSLLLGASNYVMQKICAPTRLDLNRAHAKADWLDIGVLSVRNLSRIPVQRALLYILLGLSSLPIHLLYNSAVFKSTTSYDYTAWIAAPDFASNATALATLVDLPGNQEFSNPFGLFVQDVIPMVQFFYNSASNNSAVQRLNNSECITAYSADFLTRRSDVLLISSCPNAFGRGDPSEWTFQPVVWGPGSETDFWICEQTSCSAKVLLQSADDWAFMGCSVDYCLSRTQEEDCELKFSEFILLAVIVCNIVKAVVMTCVLLHYETDSLITVGDAIASYLTSHDPYSTGMCLIGRNDLRHLSSGKIPSKDPVPTMLQSAKRRTWYSASSHKRWITTLLPCFIVIVAATTLLVRAIQDPSYSQTAPVSSPFREGFGQLNPLNLIQIQPSLIPDVMVANSPQAVVSFIYVSYNALWTSMLLASEWEQYYLHPETLRVTAPKGQQRSTYWLQLPYTYSLPLLIAMTMLHWLISESLFSAQVKIQWPWGSDPKFTPVDENGVAGTVSLLGFSYLPLLLSIIWGALMVVAVILVSFRRFRHPMPLVASCSLAISAACHPPDDDEDAAYFPINWGAIGPHNPGVGHCCFTTHPVHAPEPGKEYAGKAQEAEYKAKAA